MALYDWKKNRVALLNKQVAQAVARFNACHDPTENWRARRKLFVVREIELLHPSMQRERIEQAYDRLGF